MKKYPGREVRKWYIDTLTGLTVNERVIPVKNIASKNMKPPFILLVGQTANSADTKDTYNDNVSITVQVVTAFQGDFGGDAVADDITDAVIEKITENRPYYGTTENFKIITCQISANDTLRDQSPSELYIARQITFQHFVSQLNNLS